MFLLSSLHWHPTPGKITQPVAEGGYNTKQSELHDWMSLRQHTKNMATDSQLQERDRMAKTLWRDGVIKVVESYIRRLEIQAEMEDRMGEVWSTYIYNSVKQTLARIRLIMLVCIVD